MKQAEFKTARYDNITQEQADRMTFEQQRIIALEKRVEELEQQMLLCLRYIRKYAEDRNEELKGRVIASTIAEA